MNVYILVNKADATEELCSSGVSGKASMVKSLDGSQCLLEFKSVEHFSVFDVEGKVLTHEEAVALVKSDAFQEKMK